ncbi:hypothetical protein HYR99_37205 [Candidatus Poribacteria bacterium]|nr:hypothetical protein [Candidatus Poribacteria bacterium]
MNYPTKPVSKGDLHDNAPNVRNICEKTFRLLVTTQYGSYPHTDDGVFVRRIFHKLRSVASKNFNEPFKGIFDAHGQVPTQGFTHTKRKAKGGSFRVSDGLAVSLSERIPLTSGAESVSFSHLKHKAVSRRDDRAIGFLNTHISILPQILRPNFNRMINDEC